MSAAPDGRDPPAAITEDLIREILLRFPRDNPSSLLRDTLVCKPWIHALSVQGILRRLHEVHGVPPVLGFLHDAKICLLPSFVPDTASMSSLSAPDSRFWRVLNHRHGRSLFISVDREGPQDLLVWDPITGYQRLVPAPSAYRAVHLANAAVLCAVDGCDHRDCHGGPFRVVFTCINEESRRSACVYSSETGTWGEPTTVVDVPFDFTEPGVVVGSSLVYFAGALGFILKYDLAKHRLSWFKAPDMPEGSQDSRVVLMLTENGGLGAAIAFESRLYLYLWSREQEEEARWVQSSVINLANFHESPEVMGFADGANAIFMSTVAVLFSIELHPERARNARPLIPIVSFYKPAGDGERERKEQKTLEWVHELFDQGSKLMEEGDFRNAVLCLFLNHDLKNMIACHGRLAPECASAYYKYGCVLLHKAQDASSEKSVIGTISKDYTHNSKTSSSNDEAASSSEEGDSEKGNNVDSDLDLATKMFAFAREIVEKSPENTIEKVKILFALADVSLERDDLDSLPGYYYKASSILEKLVEPDHPRMVELNFRVYFVLELRSILQDAIPYCAKAISLCNSHTQRLKHALEALSVGNDASSAKGGSIKSAREDDIEFFTRISTELMEKLVGLVQEMRTPSPVVHETVKRDLPRRHVSGNLARLCQELQVS